jgi:hypothetical protein
MNWSVFGNGGQSWERALARDRAPESRVRPFHTCCTGTRE